MVRRQKRRRVSTAALAIVGLLWSGVTAAVAQSTDGSAATSESSVVTFEHSDHGELLNVREIAMAGELTSDGACQLQIPDLELNGNETAIEARQISLDTATCEAVFEVGEPTDTALDPALDSEAWSTVLDVALSLSRRATQGTEFSAASQTTSTGYWHNWWEDPVHLSVHGVKKWISWSWNGTCVLSASGWTDYHWKSSTGWVKTSSGSWINTSGCSSRSSWADATYKNPDFCGPGTVWSYYYDNVKVTGKKDGSLSGHTNATWTTYPPLCPHLHLHTRLTKTAG